MGWNAGLKGWPRGGQGWGACSSAGKATLEGSGLALTFVFLGPPLPTEKSEASPAPGPLADSGPAALAAALEDCLSQEVQDSFSFLEDSSSSEPEWAGAEDGEAAKAGAAFSPGEEDPGLGYLEELLGAGPQVRSSLLGWAVRNPEERQDPVLSTAVPTGGGVLRGAPPG